MESVKRAAEKMHTEDLYVSADVYDLQALYLGIIYVLTTNNMRVKNSQRQKRATFNSADARSHKIAYPHSRNQRSPAISAAYGRDEATFGAKVPG